MSAHFEKIPVKQIKKETEDCVSVLLDVPEHLKEKFQYRHGQHLTLRTFINGEELRRNYSLCSSPLQNEWRIAVKKLNGGLFSSFANEQLKIGDELEIMPPMGHFSITLNATNKKQYVAFAAGSGITPVISIIKTVLALEAKSNIILVYANRNRLSIIFKEELEALKNKYMNRFSVIFILSREKTDAAINHGRIDAAKCEQLFSKVLNIHSDEFFICGPEEMIFIVKDFLEQKGVAQKKIHFELFTTPDQKKTTVVRHTPKEASGAKSKIVVKLDGRAFDFELLFSSDESILDAALKQGADLPFACKGGVCCTCKAKLMEGEVDMDVNYGLDQEEVDQGFILTCQSHPRTETVVVDYDVK
ncbi:MAG: 1,2-phenylacetyl-CoA epoxidase subunit PaaE [Parafilimonas sp.]